jgi:hypothetical protein
LPQLARHGVTPEVFLSPCNPAGPTHNREVAYRALSWAASFARPVLFVEDDIDVGPDFAWHVDVAVGLDALTYLYLNDTVSRLRAHHGRELAERITNRARIERGAYAVRERAALFGTQCVVIPARLVPVMIERLSSDEAARGEHPTDGVLHVWARRHPHEGVYVMLPHPVQHRQVRTGRSPLHRTLRSMSFGMPWVDTRESDGVVEAFVPRTVRSEDVRAHYEAVLRERARARRAARLARLAGDRAGG